MSKLLKNLIKRGLINPPSFMTDNTQYLCIMGSSAYGVSNSDSDIDIYGYCIPPKGILFNNYDGYIPRIDRNIPNFEQFQKHHVKDDKKEYDFSIYSILKYFKLVMENNPNMIDSLFVPRRCVIHSTQIHEHVRENRNKFLHKGAFQKFKGYSYSQMHKMGIKKPSKDSKRLISVQKNGYDLKFAYHIVRLLSEAEQILTTGTIDLQQNREQLKSIRRGEWTKEQIIQYFEKKEVQLEELYNKSDLPHSPNIEWVKNLYLECLEMHYGSLSDAVERNKDVDMLINDIGEILKRYR
jgi:predicted nucleotidyltransferase